MTWDEVFMGIKSMASMFKNDLISPALGYLTDLQLQGLDPPDEIEEVFDGFPCFTWGVGKVKTRVVIDNPMQATIITVKL